MRQRLLRTALLVAALLEPALSAQKIRFERVGAEVGLSHNSVIAILEDREGFLWLGTYDGLNRYDGREVTVWRRDLRDESSLTSSEVWCLLEDREGSLWVGTAGGLNRYDRRADAFVRYPLLGRPEAGYPGAVWTLFEDSQGTVWAGLSGGLFRWNRESESFDSFLHQPGDPRSLAQGRVLGIQESAQGELWILTGQWNTFPATLHRLDREREGFTRFPAPADWVRSGSFLIDDSGRFWINVSGLGTFDPQSARFELPVLAERYAAHTPPIHQSRDGLLWIPTLAGFLVVDPESRRIVGRHPQLESADQLSGFAMSFAEDREGSRWLGTRGGLYRWDRRRKPFAHWPRRSADSDDPKRAPVSSVVEDRSGSIWVGTYGFGLRVLSGDGEEVVAYLHDPTDPSSLCHDSVWHLHQDRVGTLWLGVDDGLCSYDRARDRFTRHRLPLTVPVAEPSESRVTSIVEDSVGRLWLGTANGLVRYDPVSQSAAHFPRTGDDRGPSGASLHTLYLEGDTLWLGTAGGGLDRMDLTSGLFEHYPLLTQSGEALQSEGAFHIHRDSSGTLWLATGAGLTRFDARSRSFEHLSSSDGLPASVVYSLLEDDDGLLWLATSHGLSRYDADAPVGDRFRNYDLSDGLGNLEFNRHAAWRLRDGRFVLGGMDGLTVFRPAEVLDNPVPPPLALTAIRVWSRDGTRRLHPWGLKKLELSHRESSFGIDFVALSYAEPGKNRYAYRLEGFDESWIDAGTEPSARYTNIPPGSYVFRARGSNNDGIWNQEGVSLAIAISPPYWQTWWFRSALVAAVLGALAALYRYRVGRLLEIERLRVRIAGDLHDDLSSDLSGIALTAAMLRGQAYLEPQDRLRLRDVERSTRGILEGLRDIVWYINPEHDSVAAMSRRMEATASALLGETHHSFEYDLAERNAEIGMSLRRNVFLVFKEALHNAVRHSEAQNVKVCLAQLDGSLLLEVVDDGVGFDEAEVEGGYGLRSMRRRAEEMGGCLTIDSELGNGTTVRLEASLSKRRASRSQKVGSSHR